MSDNEGLVIGKNAVTEALRAGAGIDKVFISKSEINGDAALRHIASTARAAGAAVVEADKRKLDALCAGEPGGDRFVHQGVVAVVSPVKYCTIDDILSYATGRNESPIIVICDEITDPHNLGAIIRTCEVSGAHGIIIAKRRNASLGAAAVKSSSGAVFHVKIAKVPNITSAIRELKDKGVWIYGAVTDGGTLLWDTDFTGPAALVIGSEGKGISRLVRENCDLAVSIPMSGKVASLNASVSAAVLLYEICRQRRQ